MDGSEQIIEPAKFEIAQKESHVEQKEDKPKEDSQELKFGDKKFNTAQELERYVLKLESENNAYKASTSRPEVKEIEREEMDIIADDLLFSDPKSALKKVKEVATKEAMAQFEQKLAEKDAWDSFYRDNPDLKSNDEYLKWHLSSNWGDYKDLSATERAKLLAKKARAQLNKHDSPTKSEELSSGPAITARPASKTTQAKAVAQDEQPVDFISQLKAMRRKK